MSYICFRCFSLPFFCFSWHFSPLDLILKLSLTYIFKKHLWLGNRQFLQYLHYLSSTYTCIFFRTLSQRKVLSISVSLSGLTCFILHIMNPFWIKIHLFNHKFVALPQRWKKNMFISVYGVHLLYKHWSVHFSVAFLFSDPFVTNNGKSAIPCGRTDLAPVTSYFSD